MYHLTNSKLSFENGNMVLPMRFTGYVMSRIQWLDFLAFTPSAFATFQGKFSEFTFGSNMEYIVKKNAYTTLATFGAGLFYRWNDALILNVMMDVKNVRFGFSYDFNISTFLPATRVRGGFELSIIYMYKKSSIRKTGREPCPYDIM